MSIAEAQKFTDETEISEVEVVTDGESLRKMVEKVTSGAKMVTVQGYEHSLRSYHAYQCLLVIAARFSERKWVCYVIDCLPLQSQLKG